MTRKSQQYGINDALKYLLLQLAMYQIWFKIWMLTTRSCHAHIHLQWTLSMPPIRDIVESQLWVLESMLPALVGICIKPGRFARFRYLIHTKEMVRIEGLMHIFTVYETKRRQDYGNGRQLWQYAKCLHIHKCAGYISIIKYHGVRIIYCTSFSASQTCSHLNWTCK